MVSGTYDVSIDTPRFHRRGVLLLSGAGDTVAAQLKIGEDEPLEFNGPLAEKDFAFEGIGDFPGLEQVAYTAKGDVWGNSVSITFETDGGKVEVFGTRLSGAAGGEKSSHEYMMAGGRGEFGSDDNTMYSGLFGDGG